MQKIINKKIVVIGAQTQLSYQIARRLLPHNTLILTTYGGQSLQNLKQKINQEWPDIKDKVWYHYLEVDEMESQYSFDRFIMNQFGSIDVLINSFQIDFEKKGVELNEQEIRQMLSINLHGVINTCETCKILLASGGQVINVGSKLGHVSRIEDEKLRSRIESIKNMEQFSDFLYEIYDYLKLNQKLNIQMKKINERQSNPKPVFSISKLFLNMFTSILGNDLAAKNQFVNCICPGLDKQFENLPEEDQIENIIWAVGNKDLFPGWGYSAKLPFKYQEETFEREEQ